MTEDSGTCAVSDGQSDILTLTTGGTLNDEIYVHTTNAVGLFVVNAPIVYECLLSYTEAAVNLAALYAGFMDSQVADTIVDGGLGLKTSFSGAAIWKAAGSTVWSTISSLGSTQTITTSTTSSISTGYQTLRIEAKPVSASILEVAYFVNGLQLLNAAVTGRPIPIKDYVTYTGSPANMQVGAGVKCGSALAQAVAIDYIAWAQHRATSPA